MIFPEVYLEMEALPEVELETAEAFQQLEQDYNNLRNLPRLNGTVFRGNMAEQDPTVPAWAKNPAKPEYTAEDVGAVSEKDLGALSFADLETMWELI